MSDPGDDLGSAVERLFRRVDPVPDHLVQAASASVRWLDADAELAALVLDSGVAGAPPGMRSAADEPAARQLSFAAGDLVVDIEVTRRDRRVDVVGQISRPVVAAVEVGSPAGSWTGATDALGRFRATDLPSGPMWIVWTPPQARAVRTVSFLT